MKVFSRRGLSSALVLIPIVVSLSKYDFLSSSDSHPPPLTAVPAFKFNSRKHYLLYRDYLRALSAQQRRRLDHHTNVGSRLPLKSQARITDLSYPLSNSTARNGSALSPSCPECRPQTLRHLSLRRCRIPGCAIEQLAPHTS
jgi:hypothetical protein